jgi:hypothetical protein
MQAEDEGDADWPRENLTSEEWKSLDLIKDAPADTTRYNIPPREAMMTNARHL